MLLQVSSQAPSQSGMFAILLIIAFWIFIISKGYKFGSLVTKALKKYVNDDNTKGGI